MVYDFLELATFMENTVDKAFLENNRTVIPADERSRIIHNIVYANFPICVKKFVKGEQWRLDDES